MTNHTQRPAAQRAEGLPRGPVGRAWSRVFAAAYDGLNRAAEEAGVARMRASLLGAAAGDVLEIGAGTGANLPHYRSGLHSLVLSEPDAAMRRRLERRLATGASHRVIGAPAESLPLPAAAVDTVVCTYVLCSVDLPAALAEVRRVLRPGGQLLFLEHVRSSSPGLARWQDRLNPVWRAVACGCNANRDTEAAIRAAGFTVTDLEPAEVPEELALVRPTIRGRAIPT